MKKTVVTILAITFGTVVYGQSKEEREIINEGTKLYKTEMASWYGTDIFLERFAEKKQNTGGYFSYVAGDKSICVFFSREPSPKILATFSFDSTYNVKTAVVDGQERELTKEEFDLMTIRQMAFAEIQTDTLFKSYQDMNLNLIPLNDEKGKRVYVLTGPTQHGSVVFGNDYLVTIDKGNKIKVKRELHKNIISIDYGTKDGETILSTMHTHLPETGDLITATDICTLMLYGKYAKWDQHIVISSKNVSIWDCKKDRLSVMTTKAWEKMYGNVKKQKD